MSKEKGIFIVVSAPSGAGKTTICKEVLKAFPEIAYSISYTTRPLRLGEENGRDYYFISEAEFREKIKAGDFAEWTEKFGFFYGTSIKTMRGVLDQGKNMLLDVDTEGARNLKSRFPEGVFVFILPPSLEELRKRLAGRGSENENDMSVRLEKARDEIREVFWYDYIVINGEVENAVADLKSIYLAEQNKRERVLPKIQKKFNLGG
jgi:guanylate kinase